MTTTTTTRARFVSHDDNSCTVTYHDGLDTITHELWAPRSGGYVVDASTPERRQVCERLRRLGVTLTWSPASGPLVDLARREYRAMRRAEARDLAR
jgi:hypothetical protein